MRKRAWGLAKNIFIYLVIHGIIIHEISHIIACKTLGINIRNIDLFKPTNNGASQERFPSRGQISISNVEKRSHFMLIGLAPTIIHTILSTIILYLLFTNGILSKLFAIWMAFGLLVCSFPSESDLEILDMKNKMRIQSFIVISISAYYIYTIIQVW